MIAPPPMSRPRATFHAQLRGDATVHDVLRAFMEHAEWLAPVAMFEGAEVAAARKVSFGPRQQLPADELWIFSEQGTAQQAVTNGVQLGTYVMGVPGMVLFQRLPEDVERLRINAGGWEQDALAFEKHQLSTLKKWARTVQMERALAGCADPLNTPAVLARLRGHEDYRVPLLPDGRMIAKPGHEGFDQPSVVCTSPDSYDAFVRLLDPQLGEQVRCLNVDGLGLWREVARQKIDALFLNPAGPGPVSCIAKAAFAIDEPRSA